LHSAAEQCLRRVAMSDMVENILVFSLSFLSGWVLVAAFTSGKDDDDGGPDSGLMSPVLESI